MKSAFSAYPSGLPKVAVAAGLLLGVGLPFVPTGLHAQTLDSGSGIAASQKLSTPPDAAAINQPGAMERAYAHPAKPAAQSPHVTAKPQPRTPPR